MYFFKFLLIWDFNLNVFNCLVLILIYRHHYFFVQFSFSYSCIIFVSWFGAIVKVLWDLKIATVPYRIPYCMVDKEHFELPYRTVPYHTFYSARHRAVRWCRISFPWLTLFGVLLDLSLLLYYTYVRTVSTESNNTARNASNVPLLS